MNLENLLVCKVFTVKIPRGIHAHPSAMIARIVQSFDARVHIVYQEKTVEASSMLEILELNIPFGAELEFLFDQENQEMFQLLEELLESH